MVVALTKCKGDKVQKISRVLQLGFPILGNVSNLSSILESNWASEDGPGGTGELSGQGGARVEAGIMVVNSLGEISLHWATNKIEESRLPTAKSVLQHCQDLYA